MDNISREIETLLKTLKDSSRNLKQQCKEVKNILTGLSRPSVILKIETSRETSLMEMQRENKEWKSITEYSRIVGQFQYV